MALLPQCPWGPDSLQGTPYQWHPWGGKDALPQLLILPGAPGTDALRPRASVVTFRG